MIKNQIEHKLDELIERIGGNKKQINEITKTSTIFEYKNNVLNITKMGIFKIIDQYLDIIGYDNFDIIAYRKGGNNRLIVDYKIDNNSKNEIIKFGVSYDKKDIWLFTSVMDNIVVTTNKIRSFNQELTTI